VADDPLSVVLARVEDVRPAGSGYSARCPAHEDRVSSLTVSPGESAAVVLYCHAGCSPERITAAVGLTMADLAGAPRVIAEYPYHDSDGAVIYVVERWMPKDFRVRPGLPPQSQRVLFAKQWIDHARDSDQMLYVVEGEKDAMTLIDLGIPATCNVGGAGVGKWLPHYADQVAGCRVTVVADTDDPGKRHARAVAAAVAATAKSVVLAVPSYGKDVTELLSAGYTLNHLSPLEQAQPLPLLLSSQVPLRRLEWVWPGYMPAGKLTTIEGDPGAGKSTLTIDLVARWSTEMAMPNGVAHAGPYHCLMISAEDDPEDTIVPRLRAAGADLSRVHLLSSGADPSLPFDLGVDLDALDKTINAMKIKILTLDPLASFLPDGADSHSDHKIRRALYPLHLLARRTGVSVVAVRHLSKSATKAIHAGNGSIGIIAAARAAFMVGSIPGEDESLRVIAGIKTNNSALPAPLVYRIGVDPRYDVGRIIWGGESLVSAQDVLDGGKGLDERLLAEDAAEWLAVACDHNPMTWRDIIRLGKRDGYTEITLRRGRARVLDKTINPITSNGVKLVGTYWLPKAQAATVGESFAHLEPVIAAQSDEQMSKRPTERDNGATLIGQQPESDSYPDYNTCEICQSTDATLFDTPVFAARCPTHDPTTWIMGGGDDE
jgi:putative DNA primase/helicase